MFDNEKSVISKMIVYYRQEHAVSLDCIELNSPQSQLEALKEAEQSQWYKR